MNVYYNVAKDLSPLDRFLTDIAVSIQLSKTDYDKAVSRYDTMRDWIDREGSQLAGRVRNMYPQGSMAIGATVARATEDAEYDLDIMVELDLSPQLPPALVLDKLFVAIRGEPGSRYFGKVKRNSRCVTVHYEDGMHIDLTPSVRIKDREERASYIFHHKHDAASGESYRLIANPFGLADYYASRTPEDAFALFHEQRSLFRDRNLFARAPGDPVPEQEPAYRKPKATIALQLLKRWRNILFDRADRKHLRRPPSVLLSKIVADNAGKTATLSDELIAQAQAFRLRLERAVAAEALIDERNPRTWEDKLTDRWPASSGDQLLAIQDLGSFEAAMKRLRSGYADMAEISQTLEQLFGERVARQVLKTYFDEQARASDQGTSAVVKGIGTVVGSSYGLQRSSAIVAPKNTFYGG